MLKYGFSGLALVLCVLLTAAFVVACSGGQATLGQTSAETDRAALVVFYHATDGDNWTINSNWLSDVSMGEWHGVATDSDGRVTGVDLPRNRLSGAIPPELGNLANLETVALGENQLTGEIPPELGKLANLLWLSFSSNQLSGELPPELGNLANLEELYLGGNQLIGEVPPELGNLTNLRVLNLAETQLNGCVPVSLRGQLNIISTDLGGLPFCSE